MSNAYLIRKSDALRIYNQHVRFEGDPEPDLKDLENYFDRVLTGWTGDRGNYCCVIPDADELDEGETTRENEFEEMARSHAARDTTRKPITELAQFLVMLKRVQCTYVIDHTVMRTVVRVRASETSTTQYYFDPANGKLAEVG